MRARNCISIMSNYLNQSRILTFLLTFFLLTACELQAKSTPTATEEPALPPTQAPATVEPSPTQAEEGPVAINPNITLDPALTQDADSLMVSQYIYEGLVSLDASENPQPALAESWVVSDDQLDYIFKLRANASFSDGTPVTPDVVAENFNRWFDPQHPLHGNGNYVVWQKTFLGFHSEKGADKRPVSTVDGIQKVDFNTVLIHLNRLEPKLLTYLADPAFAILSTEALMTDSAYGGRASTIISSGPYVVSSWADDGLTLSPNPKYWGTKPQEDLKFVWR
jgi:ABC-type transport system substrate-binding protein